MRGSDWARVGTVAGMTWLAADGGSIAAEEIRDWPCALPLAERFVAEEVWGGALPEPLPADWRSDAAAADVVAFAASPENPPRQGEARIAAFADQPGCRPPGRRAAEGAARRVRGPARGAQCTAPICD